MENFEKWSYSRSESFSTMLPLTSLQTQNSSAGGGLRQLRLRSLSGEGMVPEKVLNSLFISPFFSYIGVKDAKIFCDYLAFEFVYYYN
jgi:hypothetical protein